MQILTFLYTDIEGSTRLWELFPHAMPAAVARHEDLLRQAIADNGGSVFRMVGDGLCAVFENASNAISAALEAQIALQSGPWDETGPLRVRIAILTGEAESHGSDFSGSSLNRVARLLNVAHGGQILVSQATQLLVRDALPPHADLADLGEIRLRDLAHAERIYQLNYPDLASDFPPLASLDPRSHNLPIPPTPLIGRQVELHEILERLFNPQVRMVTLTGPGGTGKTRLGLQAAVEMVGGFEHGVYFVDLAPLHTPEAVLHAVAHTLGIRGASYRPVMEDLKEKLKDREILLLLDNMEQVTAAGPLLGDLLLDCPRLKMLVTSREPLHLRVEQVFPVPPLSLPAVDFRHYSMDRLTQYEAVRLFIERAQAVRPDFQVTNENAPAVAEICIRLDGLPLAIELAASRIRLFTPQALLERLGNRLKLLSGGARDLPARQQTLRDTIGWSYDLLTPAGQRLFELLSIFPGGATFEAVEATSNQAAGKIDIQIDPLDDLASLVDKSLVRQVSDNGAEPRYTLLETIREYAAERLEKQPEFKKEALRAYAGYFAGFIEQRWERLKSDQAEQALQELSPEIDNLRLAWGYWIAERAMGELGRFFESLWLLYDRRGWYQSMVELTTDLLEVLATTPSSPERAQQEIVLQTSLASALLVTKGYVSNEAEQAYRRALQLIEQQGEIPQLFPVLRGLSRYYSYRGDFEKAVSLGEYILDLADRLDDADMRVVGHLTLGTNYSFYSSLAQGLEHLEKGIASYVPSRRRYSLGTDPGIACNITSCMILWALGYPAKALQREKQTVDLAKQLNHPFSLAYALFHTGLLHLWTGLNEQAESYAHELNRMAEEYKLTIWQAVGTCLHGAALAGLGDGEQGLKELHLGMEIYQGLNTPPVFWSLLVLNYAQACLQTRRPQEGWDRLSSLVDVSAPSNEGVLLAEFYRLRAILMLAVSHDNAVQAEELFRQAIEVARQQNARMLELRAVLSLARLLREQGQPDQARRLLEAGYNSMPEGFDLPDLRAARKLLDDLSLFR